MSKVHGDIWVKHPEPHDVYKYSTDTYRINLTNSPVDVLLTFSKLSEIADFIDQLENCLIDYEREVE